MPTLAVVKTATMIGNVVLPIVIIILVTIIIYILYKKVLFKENYTTQDIASVDGGIVLSEDTTPGGHTLDVDSEEVKDIVSAAAAEENEGNGPNGGKDETLSQQMANISWEEAVTGEENSYDEVVTNNEKERSARFLDDMAARNAMKESTIYFENNNLTKTIRPYRPIDLDVDHRETFNHGGGQYNPNTVYYNDYHNNTLMNIMTTYRPDDGSFYSNVVANTTKSDELRQIDDIIGKATQDTVIAKMTSK